MDKRESLTARYERVLGRPLVDSESDDLQADGAEAKGSTTRREQVLNAQRTHRNRTQQYIRELEREVFRLRDENDDLRQAMDRMRGQVAEMQAAIVKTGGVPFDYTQVDQGLDSGQPQQQQEQGQEEPSFSRAVSTENPNVSIDLTGLADVSPEGSCKRHPAENPPPVYQPPLSALSTVQDHHQHHLPHQAYPDQHQHQQPLYETDSERVAQVGINFILALERPCFAHVKHAHMGYSTGAIPPGLVYNTGPGHLLNATAMLAHRYHDRNLQDWPLLLPSLDIDRLLEASARLRLDGEVTPVQIWAMVREVGRLRRSNGGGGGSVTEHEVGRLLDEFQKYVYCNSFGSVVDRATVEAVLADVLGV